MKPLLFLLVITTCLSGLVHAQSMDNNYKAAANTLQKTFKDAETVEWSTVGSLLKAKFNYNGHVAYAFFNEQNEMVCIGRTISMQQLPPMLQSSFQNKFPNCTISNVLEVSTEVGTSYYIIALNNDKKIILKSSGMDRWFVFNKTKHTIKLTE